MAETGLKEFVSAYVVEAEEQLEIASTQLLAVEAALRSGGANLKGVREAFRALHTVKGLSAMVGVEPVVAITHRMETILRVYDRRAAKLPPNVVDTLLLAIRRVKELVNAFGEGKPVPDPDAGLLRELDALDADQAPRLADLPSLRLEEGLAKKLGPLELEQLRGGLDAGQRALRIDFTPSVEKSARGVTINQVREQVERLGTIVKVFPISRPASAGGGGLTFVIVLLTTADDGAVAEASSVEPTAIELLIEPEALAPSSVLPELPPLPVLAMPALDTASIQKRGVVRVDVARLDDTVDGLAALIVNRFKLSNAVKALRASGVNTRELEEIVADGARQLRNLRAAILRVRMVPVSELLDRMPLIVRSLQRGLDRSINLELDGAGAELDKAVAERLFPALVHLIRNAVDHAIETPDERARRGKPEAGLVRVECSSRSNRWLELRVIDDGRGIDAAVVARKAQAPVPSSTAGLLALICRAGLSTRDVTTVVSGRGVGMDIVHRIVTEDLGGVLTLETEPGRGTTFILQVPLSISVVEAFSFVCAGERFVTPVGVVDEILEVDRSSLVESPQLTGQHPIQLVKHRGQVVPLLSLARVFALERPASEAVALVVKRGDERVAFAIDRMIGQQEVVVRPLNDALVKVPGVAGATDLGDGQPTLVLDLFSLGARVSAGKALSAP